MKQTYKVWAFMDKDGHFIVNRNTGIPYTSEHEGYAKAICDPGEKPVRVTVTVETEEPR